MSGGTSLEKSIRIPFSLEEALQLLAAEPGRWRPFAGGTDLMVELGTGRTSHAEFISILDLPELRGIEVLQDSVVIGAATPYSEIMSHPVLSVEFPSLVDAARWTGSIAIQNRGTIGGNIANASPAADSPPALLAYGAELELQSVRGTRRLSYAEFHTGYKTTLRAEDEIIARIHLPRLSSSFRHFYRKVGPRRALSISKVCMAAVARKERGVFRDVRLAFGSVAATPVRALEVEQYLCGKRSAEIVWTQVVRLLGKRVVPIDDIRSTATYRKKVAENLLREFLEELR
jgi:CO/xanthine dehydrogenase FAD-binding subunit